MKFDLDQPTPGDQGARTPDMISVNRQSRAVWPGSGAWMEDRRRGGTEREERGERTRRIEWQPKSRMQKGPWRDSTGLASWRAQQDSNLRPLPSEGSTLSS